MPVATSSMQSESVQSGLPRDAVNEFVYQEVIDDICDFNWNGLTQEDLIDVAWAYYHFSVQFRENLEIARNLYPDDERLMELDRGKRDTDNFSPWPGVPRSGRGCTMTILCEGRSSLRHFRGQEA